MRAQRRKWVAAAGLLLLIAAETKGAGTMRHRVRPDEFGNVEINNHSEQNKMAPVLFKHWLHRSKYTCRVCHVDIGFAMRAGETGIREQDIRNGLYCGTCHNNKVAFGPTSKSGLFAGSKSSCERCHSVGQDVRFENDFYAFQKNLPKNRFGNKIDWLKAEEEKLLTLQDYIEGVSIKTRKLKLQDDFALAAQVEEMPDIIFSHRKHAVWNGCELCHPDLFGVKKGAQPYSMQEIFEGKYCGACHDLVAFPNIACQSCHTKEVY